jgi:hypothetical protein
MPHVTGVIQKSWPHDCISELADASYQPFECARLDDAVGIE